MVLFYYIFIIIGIYSGYKSYYIRILLEYYISFIISTIIIITHLIIL